MSAPSEADVAAKLIERLLLDPAFRARFRRDPAGACREAGLDGLAQEMSLGGGKAMHTLDMRESKSSLAGVMMAAAMEGVAIYQFTENVLPHLEDIPGQIADVLSRVDLPAIPDVRGKLNAPPAPNGAAAAPAATDDLPGGAGDAVAVDAGGGGRRPRRLLLPHPRTRCPRRRPPRRRRPRRRRRRPRRRPSRRPTRRRRPRRRSRRRTRRRPRRRPPRRRPPPRWTSRPPGCRKGRSCRRPQPPKRRPRPPASAGSASPAAPRSRRAGGPCTAARGRAARRSAAAPRTRRSRPAYRMRRRTPPRFRALTRASPCRRRRCRPTPARATPRRPTTRCRSAADVNTLPTEAPSARQAIDPSQFGSVGTGGEPDPEALALLQNKNVALDPAGIAAIQAGRVDPRVVGVLTKLSQEHKITVSTPAGAATNLQSGRGMDIAAIDGETRRARQPDRARGRERTLLAGPDHPPERDRLPVRDQRPRLLHRRRPPEPSSTSASRRRSPRTGSRPRRSPPWRARRLSPRPRSPHPPPSRRPWPRRPRPPRWQRRRSPRRQPLRRPRWPRARKRS